MVQRVALRAIFCYSLNMITDEEIKHTVTSLRKLEPGFLPKDIFNEVARLSVLTAVEIVPLKMDQANKVQVLLLKRGEDDPFWKGMLHTPGAIIIASDRVGTFEDAINRVIQKELLSSPHIGSPVFTEVINIQHEIGRANCLVHWLEMTDEPKIGEYYYTDELPDNLISSQIEMIRNTAERFKSFKLDTKNSERIQ